MDAPLWGLLGRLRKIARVERRAARGRACTSAHESTTTERADALTICGTALALAQRDARHQRTGRFADPHLGATLRITSKLIELTERAETPETQRARIEHTPQAEQEIAGKGVARSQHTVERPSLPPSSMRRWSTMANSGADASQGEGWWQASDGKWYPPQTASPSIPPPPPPGS